MHCLAAALLVLYGAQAQFTPAPTIGIHGPSTPGTPTPQLPGITQGSELPGLPQGSGATGMQGPELPGLPQGSGVTGKPGPDLPQGPSATALAPARGPPIVSQSPRALPALQFVAAPSAQVTVAAQPMSPFATPNFASMPVASPALGVPAVPMVAAQINSTRFGPSALAQNMTCFNECIERAYNDLHCPPYIASPFNALRCICASGDSYVGSLGKCSSSCGFDSSTDHKVQQQEIAIPKQCAWLTSNLQRVKALEEQVSSFIAKNPTAVDIPAPAAAPPLPGLPVSPPDLIPPFSATESARMCPKAIFGDQTWRCCCANRNILTPAKQDSEELRTLKKQEMGLACEMVTLGTEQFGEKFHNSAADLVPPEAWRGGIFGLFFFFIAVVW